MEAIRKELQVIADGLQTLARQTESLISSLPPPNSVRKTPKKTKKTAAPTSVAKAGVRKATPSRVKASKASARRMDRNQVMKLILDMRSDGASFEDIAQHLHSNGIPTFSGRGRWRKQTVHKLHQQSA